MKRNERVTHIMTSDVDTVHTGMKLSEVRVMLAERPYHHVPVVSGKRLIGIISATDMVRLSLGLYGTDQRAVDAMLDANHSIEDVMTPAPKTMRVTQTVRDTAEMLSDGAFHAVPVVDDEGNLEGIVTSTDVIRYLLEQY